MDYLLHSVHFGLWAYIVLFLGMLFEGTLFLLTVSFLIAQGLLNPLFAVPLLVAGSFLEELMWYAIGRSLSAWPRLANWADRIAERFDPHILTKTFRTFTVSKYIYGVHRPIIARAGMLKMSLGKFTLNALPSTVIWLLIIGSIGFGFSASYDVLKRYVTFAEIIPLAILLIAFGINKYFTPRLKKEL